MTLTQEGADAPPVPEGHVRLTIDDRVVDAPKGELIIRTCERLGIIVPRFCDHPLLDLCDNILGRAFCALGDGATSPITSSIQFFRDEYVAHVTGGGCPFDPVASTVFAGAHA